LSGGVGSVALRQFYDGAYGLRVQVGALDPGDGDGLGGDQHVSLSQEVFRSLCVQDDPGVRSCCDSEGDAAGHVGLYMLGDDVCCRFLG